MKKMKKKVISIITGTSIIGATLSTGAKIVSDGYVCTIYNLKREQIVSDFDADGFDSLFSGDNFLSYTKFPSFSSRIIDEINTPSYKNMVPQGITIMDDYILVSCYDSSHSENSIIRVFERDGTEVNLCYLDIKSHVGGISYDKENKLVWIPANNGKINAYKAIDFLNKSNVTATFSNLDVGHRLLDYKNPLKNSIAFLTIRNGELFVGSFSLVSNGLVKRYSIEHLGDKIKLTYAGEFSVPTRVQGIEFYNKDDKEYMILSRSFGQSNSSILQIFSYDRDVVDYNDESVVSISYEAPSMMEQIAIEDGCLYSLFESGAVAYNSCKYRINDICVLEVDKIISKCK